ncbi:MAG: protein phosphatase 2C domain-containing protein [Ileibacterium sp.]|nr:protein phosphatase 2C domain-containing protein [Ileibacterium sp.]
MILEFASVIGTLHENFGLPNQDCAVTFQSEDWYGAVVCDGVSLNSKHEFSNSEIASAWCAAFIKDYLPERLKDLDDGQVLPLLGETFEECDAGLKAWLFAMGIPYYDCQTTVLCMLLHEGSLYTALAGDGGVIYMCADGSVGLMITKEKVSASVSPICHPDGWRFMKYTEPGNPVIKALAATDGIFDQIFANQDGRRYINARKVSELFGLDQIDPARRKNWLENQAASIESHDDRTLALIIDDSKRE